MSFTSATPCAMVAAALACAWSTVASAESTGRRPLDDEVSRVKVIADLRVVEVHADEYVGVVDRTLKGPAPEGAVRVPLPDAQVFRKPGQLAIVWLWPDDAAFLEPTGQVWDPKSRSSLAKVPMGADPGYREGLETVVRLERETTQEARTALVTGLLRSRYWQARSIGLSLAYARSRYGLGDDLVPLVIQIANRCDGTVDELWQSMTAIQVLGHYRSEVTIAALFPLLECENPKVAAAALSKLEHLMFTKLPVDLTKPPAQRAARIRELREWWAEVHDRWPPRGRPPLPPGYRGALPPEPPRPPPGLETSPPPAPAPK